MSLETLGTVIQPSEADRQIEAVTFTVPYGEREFEIQLSDEEMNTIMLKGVERVLAGRPMDTFDYEIELEPGELPLFAGLRSMEISHQSLARDSIEATINIVSQSMVYEHRGILQARRQNVDGNWQAIDYEIQPPLRDSFT